MRGGKKALLLAAAAAAAVTTTTTSTDTTTSPTTETPETTTPTPTPTPTPTSTLVVIPAGYTAKPAPFTCDGVTDRAAALQSAFNALTAYQALVLPAGTCLYSSRLNLAKKDVAVVGQGIGVTILKSTNAASSSLIIPINSARVHVANFSIHGVATQRVATGGLGRCVYADTASAITVDRIDCFNVQNAGILFRKVNGGSISNSIVTKSWADAFHITGSQNVTLSFNRAKDSGDDCFASIGYGSPAPNRNISFFDGVCENGHWASGVSFEGTIGGKAYRNRIVGTGAACIRIDSQQSYKTGEVDSIDLQDNYLEGCDQRKIGHGGVIIYTNLHPVGPNIVFNRTTIKNAPHGFRIFGNNGATARAEAHNSTMFVTTPFKVDAGGTLLRSGNTNNGVVAY